MESKGERFFGKWSCWIVFWLALNSQYFSSPNQVLSAAADLPAWETHSTEARTAFDQSRYLEALGGYRAALADAEAAGEPPGVTGRIRNSVGACWLGLGNYRAALSEFLRALPLVEQAGDAERQAAVETNIASVYLFQGDRENAHRLYRRALDNLQKQTQFPDSVARIKPLILANLGALERLDGRYRQALAYEQAALAGAAAGADPARWAGVYDLLGLTHLDRREYPQAREAFEQALRLRQPLGDTARSWMFLGRLDLASGRAAAALEPFDRAATEARRIDDRRTLWQILYWRGTAWRRQGRRQEAAADLGEAAGVLESLRASVIPTDGLLVQFESQYHDVFEAWADLLCETAAGAGDAVAAEAFHAVESGRAYSLRALLARRPDPPDAAAPTLWRQYQDRLRRLEQVRARARAAGDPAPWLARVGEEEAASRDLEARLRVEEPVLSNALFAPALTLPETQALLGQQDLLLSFYVRPRAAWLWAVTRRQARFYRLAPPATWTPEVRRFLSALREGGDTKGPGRHLYRALLGPVDPELLARRRWMVAADGEAALLPFAALPAVSGRYVIEERAVSYTPAVSVLPGLREREAYTYERDFLALADPIVNTADPRLPARRAAAPGEALLPRLASSAAEAQACARLFGAARSTVLTGAAVSESGLRRQAAAGYRYWHLTSHVIVDAERPNTSFIALSLPEKLTVLEVLSLPARAEMVTLNGCESGGGKLLPGTGVLGLTRAFLAAGAVSVLATRWQIPDESGALVQALYRNLLAAGSCRAGRSEALRQAQLEMLRAGGWRSEPRYWAAYFLSGWPGSDSCAGSDHGGAL